MKNVKLIGWVSMLFLLFLTSCREENFDPKTTINLPQPVVFVESTVTGQVIDENNDPVSAVSIKLGDKEIMTDEHGFFKFSKMNMNKNGTHITANKFGYFFNSKMLNPALGNKSFVLFQMLDKVNIGSFNTADGGELSTTDGASVTFGANAIMYENGAPYTGMVEVSAKWLDPTHAQIADRMPGDLRAINTEEELVQLATYGMLVVELEAPNGSALQLSEGATATISLPVPEAILSAAPGTIPLWSFDEATGYWLEESSASLQGDKYIGDVSHFSYWNCDEPFLVVEMEGSLINNDGDPVQYIKVSIGNDNVGVRHAWTDSDGKIYGKIPKNEALTITVIDQCNTEIFTDNIGPFSADIVLDPITILNLIEAGLSGTLLKCDGTPVTNGYAFIKGNVYDIFLPTDENGFFEKQSAVLCEIQDMVIRGYDLDIPLTSEPTTFSIPSTGGYIEIGDIEVCDVITEIVHIEIPDLGYSNDLFIYTASDLTAAGGGILIIVHVDSLLLSMEIDITSMATGNADMLLFTFQDYENPDTQELYFLCQSTGGAFDCPSHEVTKNEGSAGLLTGSFNREFGTEQSGGTTYQFTVEYNVILQ